VIGSGYTRSRDQAKEAQRGAEKAKTDLTEHLKGQEKLEEVS